MNNLKFISRVQYSTLMDEIIPLSFYDLYENEKHKFAVLTFHNKSKNIISSFKIKFTFFTIENEFISTAIYEVKTKRLYPKRDFELSDPLVIPKNASGFNYEIIDVATIDKNKEKKNSLIIGNGSFLRAKSARAYNGNVFAKWKFLGLASLIIACLSTTAFEIGRAINIWNHSNNQSYNDNSGIIDDSISNNKIEYKNWKFTIEKDSNSSNGYVITRGVNIDNVEALYIPSYLNGHKITRISTDAFSGQYFGRVYFDNSNLVLDDYAFLECYNLVSIDGTVGTINSHVFNNCKNLNSINLNVNYIYDYAFSNCSSLMDVNIFSCNSIYQHAFYNCTSLSSINIGCTNIGFQAFYGCENLRNVSISNCELIDSDAFSNCLNISYLNLTNVNCIYSGIFNYLSNLSSMTIESCKVIGDSSFANCSSLKGVIMLNCGTIESSAFYGCSSLNYANLNVDFISSYSFNYCENLTELRIENCQNISSYAFSGCYNISDCYINSNCNIEDKAFEDTVIINKI